ncbi:protein-ADP-ribose hydrolase [Holophaga foetida]|uniref:protein-ADP-ribose hydrolase n=1 Tax=Holophaga foetida TaxID=35839 RepID=UPI00024721AB|nr:protein-ADP-ribose hydrolase [Holophaga foetida]
MPPLPLQAYRDLVAIDLPWSRPCPCEGEEAQAVLERVLDFLGAGEGFREPRRLLRGLLNRRPPGNWSEELLVELDRLLWAERLAGGWVEADALPSVRESFGYGASGRLILWRGDITRLGVDAIVNAANSELLGCFSPLHACIDNAIHSAAGPRLREDCARIMALQGEPEPTGTAKLTRAYNLPSRFVLHTVGPIVQGRLTAEHRRLLASCYTACLDLAAQVEEIRTLAFCGISTGVFGFPAEEAAPIALETVSRWLERYPDRFKSILFNVYTEEDHERYRRLFLR